MYDKIWIINSNNLEAEMQNIIEAIKERMTSLTDEILIKIVTEDADDYEAEALQIAREELAFRKINIDDIKNKKHFQYIINCTDICMGDLVPFGDIVHQVDYSLVEEALQKFYPDEKEFLSEYKDFYNNLLQLNPTNIKYVLINVEKEPINIDDLVVDIWNVFGTDTESGEKLNVELFSWNDWLSFFVDHKYLQEVGNESFLAHCFYKMAINGFNDDDINRNIEIKAGEATYNRFLYNTIKSNSIDTINDNIFKTSRDLKLKVISREVSQIRPWIRFWARTLDSTTLLLLFLILIKSFTPFKWNMQFLGVSLIPSILAFIESILLSTWGTTLGKWILGIKVRTIDGNKLSYSQSLYRSIMVWILGEAASLNNILSTFTYLVSYFRLTNMGSTYWDEKGKFSVTHERIGIVRGIVAVVLGLVITSLATKLLLLK